jgi:hypothetical protein
MLNKCANSLCPNLFRLLNRGRLFLLETDCGPAAVRSHSSLGRRGPVARRTERYWLCDDCCGQLTLTFERGRGMVTVPLPARNASAHALHLNPVQSEIKRERRFERAV